MNLPQLRALLEPLAQRQHAVTRSLGLALCWLIAALAGLVLLALGASGPKGWLLILMLGVLSSLAFWRWSRHRRPDWHVLAHSIESRCPDLDGRLLTALDQEPGASGHLNYLQMRVLRECVIHSLNQPWSSCLPYMWVKAARGIHAAALVAFAIVVGSLAAGRNGGGDEASLARDVTITPGDVTLERGDTLVVMARFDGVEPAMAELVLTRPGEPEQRMPLVKSLADPLFGISVPGLDHDLAYRVEYDTGRSRDFSVDVFDYPRLERADATITYPAYTGLPVKRIDDTRRVSAVQGSLLDLSLRLNKPVTKAVLVPEGMAQVEIPLEWVSDAPAATLTGLALDESHTFQLRLTDAEGRTNTAPARFVIRVYPNRPPELKIAAPAGDSRPSPLEEVTFEGTVWDDFGVQAYGLAYSPAGEPPTFVALGGKVTEREARAYAHVLPMEEIGVEPEDLVTWFVWADDIGPDGNLRRTMGSMYFAEIRPFDEIFREGQAEAGGPPGEQGGQPGGGGGEATGELADRLKEIINATWRLQREAAVPPTRSPEGEQTRVPVDRPDRTRVQPVFASRGAPGPRPAAPAFGMPARSAWHPSGGLFAQRANLGPDGSQPTPADPTERAPAPAAQSDIDVLREAQAQALDMAIEARGNQEDPRAVAQWDDVIEQMQVALDKLAEAGQSPQAFQDANAAQQAAYEALLRLQQREYSVAQRNQQQNQGQSSARQRQMQNQLDQLELTQSENRYETERQAAAPQTEERREDLQIMSRLRELARRQENLNQRLQELQTALQEARSREEREEIERELKRLTDEQREMVEDADALQQRMDSPENQSRMSRQRDQLEQAREDMQRATEAAEQGEVSQALAAGARAQQNMREMREEMRRNRAGEFTEEMQQLRAEARELARRQEEIRDQLAEADDPSGQRLSDDALAPETQQQLAEQAERLSGLLDQVTELSRQSDEAEPLMSRELYTSLREHTQEDQEAAREAIQDLVDRGLMNRDLYQRMQELREASDARMVDVTSELLREGYLPEARQAEARARTGIDALRRGIERAAERVLGDETEALRLARDQLDELAEELEEEMQQAQADGDTGAGQPRPGEGDVPGQEGEAESEEARAGTGEGSREPSPGDPSEGGSTSLDLAELVEQRGIQEGNPLTGGGFGGWSDRLREVEELVEDPVLRGELARARERARLYRQAYRREGERPDWVEVKLDVMTPLVEVRSAIAEELVRREPRDQLVPIDRDAVPSRYQELVRRYYEALGKDE